MIHLPQEALDRFRWTYIGDPDTTLFGGGLRDRSARLDDEKKRLTMSHKLQDKPYKNPTKAYFIKLWNQQGANLETPSDARI